ncbi:hypothetical protein BKA57DRAFT_507399 [Linnemannia elongata]|nr:hypothetical protein BKA57DRAFT_507399 [Linnemannia elongata]KAK5821305.1 hypothetical protein F5H01DRAFT_365677 [Linnemannia elongata]
MSQKQQQQDQQHPPHDHFPTRRHEDEFTSKPHSQQQQQQQQEQHPECTLYSLVQYECDLSPSNIVCKPIFRLLKKCKGRPTVEVTPLYDPAGNILYG